MYLEISLSLLDFLEQVFGKIIVLRCWRSDRVVWWGTYSMKQTRYIHWLLNYSRDTEARQFGRTWNNRARRVLVCVVLASEGSLERPASQLCQVPSFLRSARGEPLSVTHTSRYTNPCCQPCWLYGFYLGCRQNVWPSLSDFWAIQNICNPFIYFTLCK